MTRYTPAASKQIKFILAVMACLMAQPLSAQQAQAPQQGVQPQQIKTLAVVNGEEISRQQVANECMRRFGTDTLESIVNKFLVAMECQRAGIVITEKDVNDEITKTAKAFGMSGERYLQTICSRRDITPDRFKNDVIWNQLALERLAAKDIQVTPEEINRRMEYQFGERVQVRQIVCDSLQKANQIQQAAAANPNDFERLAKQHSIDRNSASMGGLMWPVRRNSELPELEKLAFSLKVGEVSRVLPIADTFVIIRCERRFEAETIPPEQLTYAHERIVEELRANKLRQAATDMFARLQANTKIVNVMNDPQKRQQMPGVAALVNDRQILINRVAEDCITRFGTSMLDTEINRTILLQEMKKRGVQVTEADIEEEIKRAASAVGYLNSDGTVNRAAWISFMTGNDPSKERFYIEDEIWPTVALKKLVASSVAVTQEDLQKGFEANFAPRVEALGIVLNDNRSAQKVWNLATAVQGEIAERADYFGKLANQYSIDPATKNNFGEMIPIPRHGGQPALENEAFRLQPGEISQIVQVGDSFVILFCKGRTEPVVAEIDAVKDELYSDIHEKKMRIAMAREFQRLRDSAQIDNFLSGTSQPGAAAVQATRQAQGQRRGTRR